MKKLALFHYDRDRVPERSSNPWQINITSRVIFNATVLQAMRQRSGPTSTCGYSTAWCISAVILSRLWMKTGEMVQHALTQIQHIYKIERQCDEAGLSYDERRQTRQELSRPIMEAMKVWMETEGIKYSPSSLTGKAITYAYTKWDNIMRCLDDGRLYWDNNLAENVQRPITLSRKNFLFCGNHEAAANMSVICSLLATCKAHDVNPRNYLNDVIAQMPYHKNATHEILLDLLPHKWKLKHPESILTKQHGVSDN